LTFLRTKVGVVGAGAWGTALAILANRAGSEVTLWTRNEAVLAAISERRVNEIYLPECLLDPAIRVTDHLPDISASDIVVLSVPSQSLRTACITLSDLVHPELPLVISSKGIERGSLALMSEVVAAILPQNPVAVLSGPNFAGEAARGLPAAATLACADTVMAEHICDALGSRMFRPYLSDDLIGAQVAGAVKNVLAIACGVAQGKGLGENARAALITRGLAEMARLAHARGGREETLMGLCGIGDLVLTCSSTKSRNFSLGYELGRGNPVRGALSAHLHGLTEGVETADSLYEISLKQGIPMPICTTMHHILKGHLSMAEGVEELLERPFTFEHA
jgi:glycerol-3-phosphate dehydrogenase (NAD(P)+)